MARSSLLLSGYKMVLVVRTDAGMKKGKIASQCAHASVLLYRDLITNDSREQILDWWTRHGMPKIVVKCPNEERLLQLEEEARRMGIANVLIRDAGRTQVEAGTSTVLGLGPALISHLDVLTKNLKLL